MEVYGVVLGVPTIFNEIQVWASCWPSIRWIPDCSNNWLTRTVSADGSLVHHGSTSTRCRLQNELLRRDLCRCSADSYPVVCRVEHKPWFIRAGMWFLRHSRRFGDWNFHSRKSSKNGMKMIGGRGMWLWSLTIWISELESNWKCVIISLEVGTSANVVVPVQDLDVCSTGFCKYLTLRCMKYSTDNFAYNGSHRTHSIISLISLSCSLFLTVRSFSFLWLMILKIFSSNLIYYIPVIKVFWMKSSWRDL